MRYLFQSPCLSPREAVSQWTETPWGTVQYITSTLVTHASRLYTKDLLTPQHGTDTGTASSVALVVELRGDRRLQRALEALEAEPLRCLRTFHVVGDAQVLLQF